MKTGLEIFESFDADVRAEIKLEIENDKESPDFDYAMKDKFSRAKGFLILSFYWGNSEKGCEYWNNIYNSL